MTIKTEWGLDPAYWTEYTLLDINEAICKLMSDANVSRADLARRLGKSRAYVTRILNGMPNMTIETLVGISVALGRRPVFSMDPLTQSDSLETIAWPELNEESYVTRTFKVKKKSVENVNLSPAA